MNLPSKDVVPDKVKTEPLFKSGYLFGLGDAATVVMNQMKHSDSVEEVLFGQAIIAALKNIGASV